jgi:hypothetical protein
MRNTERDSSNAEVTMALGLVVAPVRKLQSSRVPGVPESNFDCHQDGLTGFADYLLTQEMFIGIAETFQGKDQIVVAFHDTTEPFLKLSLDRSLGRGKLQYFTRGFRWHNHLFYEWVSRPGMIEELHSGESLVPLPSPSPERIDHRVLGIAA